VIWPALRNINDSKVRSAREWKLSMNQFSILYGDRFVSRANQSNPPRTRKSDMFPKHPLNSGLCDIMHLPGPLQDTLFFLYLIMVDETWSVNFMFDTSSQGDGYARSTCTMTSTPRRTHRDRHQAAGCAHRAQARRAVQIPRYTAEAAARQSRRLSTNGTNVSAVSVAEKLGKRSRSPIGRSDPGRSHAFTVSQLRSVSSSKRRPGQSAALLDISESRRI
jgi:hypothetical protein